MTQLQRIAALLLISLLLLQVFAQDVAKKEKKEGNVMTVTFDAPTDVVAGTDIEPAIDLIKQEKKLFHKQDAEVTTDDMSRDEQKQKEDVDLEALRATAEQDAPVKAQEQQEQQFSLEDELMNYPYVDYMGEEIDQFLGESAPDMDSFVIEEEVSYPASSSIAIAEKQINAASITNVTTPTASTGPRPPKPQVTSCKTQGQIALTYSEGPSDVTAKIVRQLTKAEARANFFVNATWLYTQQYAMVLQNIYNAGHFIGMTYRVANDDPSRLTDEQIRDDILNNAHIIESLINVAPKYVRLHYTEEKDERTEGILSDLGFVIVGYNLDSQDYFKKDAMGPDSIQQIYSETFQKYKDTYDVKGSFISIQYDLPFTGSLTAIPHIINTIEEEGYTMVRLDGCLNDATPYKKTANGTEYIGDKFSFGEKNYHQGQKAIVLETAAEAAIADEEFKIQGIESTSIASNLQVPISIFLFVCTVFTLFL